MAVYEEGYNLVCGAVFDLPKIQGRASDTPRKNATVTHSYVEAEEITMDFITKLPRMARGVVSIWVIVD